MSTDARSACTVFFGALLLLLAFGSVAVFDQRSFHAPFQALTGNVQVFEETPGHPLEAQQALQQVRWRPASKALLSAPRRHTTLWLRLKVQAPDQQVTERWLEVAPWRVGDIDLYQLDARTGEVIDHQRTGPSLPMDARAIHSQRNLLPITFVGGAPSDLLIRVQSENRPTLSLRLWEADAVQAQDRLEQLQHAVLFGCVLALVAILLLRLKLVFMTLALWLLATFAMQAEQEGYLTFQLFDGLQSIGLALRMTFWQIALLSFLTSALLLLDLRQRRAWRYFYWPSVVLIGALVLSQALWDNNTLRTLSAYLSLAVLLAWPFSISRTALRGNPYRQVLLVLFLFSWLESLWFTFNYTFAINYDGLFSISAMLIRLGIIVGIIGLFTLEQQVRRKQIEQALLQSERQQKHRLEKAVAQRTRALQTAVVEANNASQAKIEFLGRVSHDLRSPLTSIIGYAQLLQAEGGAITRKAGVIFKSANHMLALVSDLIDYAKGTSGQTLLVAPVYFHGVLDSVVMEAQVLALRRNNKFSFDLSGAVPPVVEVDAKRLRQVLINLLDNAAKFTRDGMIGLKVRATDTPGKVGCVNLHFCVHDTGLGIAKEDLPNLFAPFFRSHAHDVEGSGLGLAIVDHWLGLMGAKVEVDSAVGDGTRIGFCLTVDVACESQIAEPQWLDFSIAVPPVLGEGRTVWVVEDNEDIRNVLVDELLNCGFSVQAAVDGEDCLARLAATALQPPALVLTDYLMPKLNGAQLLGALRERWPALPVVLISATQHSQLLPSPPHPAFDAMLIKPVNLATLRQTLAQLLGLGYRREDREDEVPCDQVLVIHQLSSLDAHRLRELSVLLEAGAVTDLFEWVQALPQELEMLAAHMCALAEACDLDAVSALLEAVPATKP
ncbi:response regulator [Pseudomonas guariconensis]|uniref:hybrid sensor histidine kinase/response regulator n=1 Tax=Pseudomonas guariconensis TaxID=1288410 RepID=UPI0018AB1EA6|nr:ATP-binding protein [Pseudomonas guariconensis]MBF8732615.1 response regulator [Pseudomonas guariconensis]